MDWKVLPPLLESFSSVPELQVTRPLLGDLSFLPLLVLQRWAKSHATSDSLESTAN